MAGKPRRAHPSKRAGRSIAKREQSEHSVHGRDGQIREKNSYGSDLNPPTDKNRSHPNVRAIRALRVTGFPLAGRHEAELA